MGRGGDGRDEEGRMIFYIAMSSFVGVLLGIIVSVVVNSTLIEISVSHFFSTYFGVLFFIVGAGMHYRIENRTEDELLGENPIHTEALKIYAKLVCVSGMLCFFLQKDTAMWLPALLKVPLYCLVGVSIAFALTFSVVDFVNYILGFMQVQDARALIASKEQMFLVLVVASLMGVMFGGVFGFMDVEDTVSYQIKMALLREEHYCYPIGAVMGGIAGAGNEYLRHKNAATAALEHFDQDI